jgi:hypothetical protein
VRVEFRGRLRTFFQELRTRLQLLFWFYDFT